MPVKNGGKPSKDILDILRAAEAENNAAMDARPAERKPEMEKTKGLADGEASKPKTKVTKRINAETAEIIDKYSTRKIQPSMSDTQKLRAKLAEQNESNDLLGYFAEEKPAGKSQRVEKLYEMINDARTRTLTDEEKKPPIGIDSARFTDQPEQVEEEEYAQEQMFPFGDTIRFEKPVDDSEVASFDDDYESLTDRVVERGVEFEHEAQTEGQVSFVNDDDGLLVDGEPLDETDINLRLAFEMMDDEDGSLAKIAEENRKKRRREHEHREVVDKSLKYTSRDQNATVAAHYRKAVRSSLVRMCAVAILAIFVLYAELATAGSKVHPEFLRPGNLGAVYILIDLQFLFFISMVMLPSLKKGIMGIATFKLNTESLLVVSVFFSTAYSLVLLFTNPKAADLQLYNLPAAFTMLCSALAQYLVARKDYRCFRIVASKRPKYVACELSGGTKEAEEFYKYLFEDSDLYTVKRTKFASGFVERTEKRVQAEDVFNFLVPLVFIAGVIVFVVMSALGNSLVSSYVAFSVIIATSVPAAGFFMISLPVVAANRIGAKHSTAFVGNAIAEEYATASVLSFSDTEVYPASLVKITNIRMYGDFRIDAVITDLAKIFGHVGGPLAKVLSATMSDKVEKPALIRLIEGANDGICVAMDGHNYFIGKKSYMRRYRFEAPIDDGDNAYEKHGGSIMYMVVDENVAAKLYIKYTINPLFDSLLKDMYRAGLCLGVKTLDPNINNEMISAAIKFRKCPISVLRGNDPDDVAGEVESVDSGVVCNSTLHNFLKMFALCDKARHITKCNVIIGIISVVLSFVAVAFLAFTGDITSIDSLSATAFQFFWTLPVWLISFLMMRK